MPSITLGFDPGVDSYDDIRAILDGIYEVPTEEAEETGPASPPAHPDAEKVLPDGWTKRRMRNYLGNVREDGLTALRIIAEHAPKVAFAEVQEAMGYSPDNATGYGGMMTTLANAAKRTRGVKHKPFDQDYATRTYSIDKQVAALVIETLDEMTE